MARIYATNAIRKRNEALNYLRMSAKFDMVASQVNSAVTTGMVSATMSNVVKGLEKAVQSDNVEKVWLGGFACLLASSWSHSRVIIIITIPIVS